MKEDTHKERPFNNILTMSSFLPQQSHKPSLSLISLYHMLTEVYVVIGIIIINKKHSKMICKNWNQEEHASSK